jgi:hypothetical protein
VGMSYPQTCIQEHVMKKKLILQPRNNQVQHIVLKVMGGGGGTGERIGEKGNSDLNRSRETLPPSAFDHPRRCDRSLPQKG